MAVRKGEWDELQQFFFPNPCSVKNIAYPKVLSTPLDSLMVTPYILKLTESFLISEKTEHK